MAIYQRAKGPKEGGRAIIHEYKGEQAKVEVQIDLEMAKKLMAVAVDQGGRIQARLTVQGENAEVTVIGARIDSIADDGSRLGGTGVIAFDSLIRIT